MMTSSFSTHWKESWVTPLVLLAAIGCGEPGGQASGDATGDSTSDESGGETEQTVCTPDLASIRTEIFADSCIDANCHDTASRAAGLDLETSDVEAELIGIASGTCDGWVRVAAGSPEDSLLYTKVAGPVPCGALMPLGRAPLDDAAIECLSGWISGLDAAPCETCGGMQCVDVDGDAQNCGACDNVCPDGIPCQNGDCSCPDGQSLCGDTCVDTQANIDNCGGCDDACMPGKVCFFGKCADTCGALTDCDGGCVETDDDPLHCGACDNACDPGSTCEAGGCDCPGDGVSFTGDVQPIFDDNCTGMGCHGFPMPAEGLDLRAGASWASLVDVDSDQCNGGKRVVPGQPGNSYLLDKLLGINLCSGTQMPKAGGALSQAEIDTVSEWICRGAQDD